MPKRTKEDWKDLAKYRILKVLRLRRVCCLRQLEVKISESGPGDMRPEPIFLTQGTSELNRESKIIILKKEAEKGTPFYAPKDFDKAVEKEIYDKILLLYEKHKFFTEKDKWCSKILEHIINTSIQETNLYKFLSNPQAPNIPKEKPLDFVIQFNQYLIGGEIKNQREWIYPDKLEIWELITKCIEIGATPIFVTRKLPYLTRVVFSKIGILGLETHNQYFDPILKDDMKEIIDKNLLGYKDIKCSKEPEQRFLTFFGKTVVNNIARYSSQFSDSLPILKGLIKNGIAEKGTSMFKRSSLVEGLKREILQQKKEEPPEDLSGYDDVDFDEG